MMRSTGPAALIPLHHDGEARSDPAAWIAHRLHSRFPGEPVRALEALAMAEVNRLKTHPPKGRPQVPPAPDDDPRFPACRRIARRALTGTIENEVGEAARYHRVNASPPWARDLLPLTEIGGFLFYAA